MLAKTSKFISVSTLFLALMALLLALPTLSEAQVVAYDMVGSASQNLVSFTDDPRIPFGSPADGFNKFQRGVSSSIPFAVLDDSAGSFPPDTLGIVKTGNTDEFFGIVDTNNGDTGGADVVATWVFDITGASDLFLSIDMGAMGDFEASPTTGDFFNWSYSIDGGPAATAFASTVDESTSHTYTMEGGTAVTLNDPMLVDGVVLTNNLAQFVAPLTGAGSQLTLILTANTDSGSEAIAFQNLIVSEGALTPAVVAYDMVGSASQNLVSFTDDPAIPFTSAADGFNKFQRGVSSSIPFAVLDDSAGSFPPDTLGIVKTGNTDEFFGIVDTNNGDTGGADVVATWVFDITGASDLFLSIDMGAMGDFEASPTTGDFFNWSYSIDGGAAATAFQSSVDESASHTYTMEGGTPVTLNDPMLMDGVVLTNDLAQFVAPLTGTGSQLTLILTANTDSGSEAIAFQSLIVSQGGPPPPPVIGFDMVGSASQNLLSFTDDPAIPFTSPGDGFNKFQRGVSASIPFAVVDDSAGSFPGDTLGIIKTGNTDEFFGIVDTNNPDTGGDPVSATWVFDITGAPGVELLIDMGAMGDFESSDWFEWAYSIDGGLTHVAFASTVDEAGSHTYTMESGTVVTLNDPIMMNGAVLTNDLAPFNTPLRGTGTELTLTLTARTDSGSEAIAFQNLILVEGEGLPPIPLLEIFDIQGAGIASPYEGMEVATTDNVVTALASGNFFMQTPDARSDGDPYTSDGIYVYTGSTPTVSVGDRVRVIGQVQEFFELTEITGSPTVDILGSGEPLPTVALFDSSTPSEIPFVIPDLERFEGMLVGFDGMASSPTNRFGELGVVIDHPRAFRESGILFPGLPGLPIWDGNPEVFDVDTDGLDATPDAVFTGQTISGYGPLTFNFGRYKVLPKMMSVGDIPDVLRGVRDRDTGEFTVGSLNMFRFFNDTDDDSPPASDGQERNDFVVSTAEYQRRTAKFVDYILNVLDAPDVLAVQEVESIEVLQDLAVAIALEDPTVMYTPILIEGNDIGTIDVGFMVRDTVSVDQITQLGKDETYWDPVNMVWDLLHDRPPLLLEGAFEFDFGSLPIAVMTVHNRSLGGIEDPVGGERVRQKRYEQAVSIAEKVQALQTTDPAVHLVVIGDFNAFEFTDGYADAVGQIMGDFEPGDNLVCDPSTGNACDDLVDPNLANQVLDLPEEERYSFIFEGSSQSLDHALTAQGLDEFLNGMEFARGNADATADLLNVDSTPLRSSDHDGLVLFVGADDDGDGVPNPVDVCPATVIPESVPTDRLGVNRYALVDDDGIFDTTAPGGRGSQGRIQSGPTDFFTVGDTGGCSCEQIIEAQHLGKGHKKFGCSLGAMRNWVKLVNP